MSQAILTDYTDLSAVDSEWELMRVDVDRIEKAIGDFSATLSEQIREHGAHPKTSLVPFSMPTMLVFAATIAVSLALNSLLFAYSATQSHFLAANLSTGVLFLLTSLCVVSDLQRNRSHFRSEKQQALAKLDLVAEQTSKLIQERLYWNTEISKIKGTAFSHSEQIKQLSRDLGQLDQEKQSRKEELTSLDNLLLIQQESLSRIQKDVEAAESKLANVCSQIDQRHFDLGAAQRDFETHSIENKRILHQQQELLDEKKEQILALEQEHHRLNTNFEQLTEQLTESVAELETIQTASQAAAISKAEFEEIIGKLETQANQLEQKIRDLQCTEQEKAKSLAMLADELATMEEVLSTKQNSLSDMEIRLQEMKAQEEVNRHQVNELDLQIRSSTMSLETLQVSEQQLSDSISEKLAGIAELERLSTFQFCNEAIRLENEENEQLATIRDEYHEKCKLLEELKAEAEIREVHFSEIHDRNAQTIHDQEQRVQLLNAKADALVTEVESRSAEIFELKKELIELRSQTKDLKPLRDSLDATQESLLQKQSQLEEMHQEEARIRPLIQTLSAEKLLLEADVLRLSATIDEQRVTLETTLRETDGQRSILEAILNDTRVQNENLRKSSEDSMIVQSELQQAKVDLASVIQQLQIHGQELEDLLKEKERAAKTLEELGLDLHNKRESIALVEDHLNHSEAKLRQSMDEWTIIQENLASSQENLSSLHQEIRLVTHDLDALRSATATESAISFDVESAKQEVTAIRDEISQLESERDSLNELVDELSTQKQKNAMEILAQEDIMISMQSQLKEVNAELESIEQTITQKEELLSKIDQDIASNESQLGQINKSIADAERRLQEAEVTVRQLEDQKAEVRYSIESTLSDYKQCEADIAEARSIAEQWSEYIAQLQKHSEETAESIAKQNEILETLMADIANQESFKQKAQCELEQLQLNIADLTREQEKLKNTIERKNDALDEIQDRFSGLQDACKEWTKEGDRARTEAEKLDKVIHDYTAQVGLLRAQIETLQDNRIQLENDRDRTIEQLQDLLKEEDRLRNKILELNHESATQESIVHEVRNLIVARDELSSEIDAAKAELDGISNEIAIVDENRRALSAEVDDLAEQCAARQQLREDLGRSINQLNQEIETGRMEMRRLEETRSSKIAEQMELLAYGNDLQATLVQLHDSNSQLKKLQHELRQQTDSLQSEFDRLQEAKALSLQDLEEIQKQCHDACDAKSNAQSEYERIQVMQEELVSRLEILQQEQETISQTVLKATGDLKGLHQEIEIANGELESRRTELADVQLQRQSIISESILLDAAALERRTEATKLQAEIDELRQIASRQLAEQSNAESKVNRLHSEILQIEGKMESLLQDLAAHQATHEALIGDIGRLEKEIDELQSEKIRVSEELVATRNQLSESNTQLELARSTSPSYGVPEPLADSSIAFHLDPEGISSRESESQVDEFEQIFVRSLRQDLNSIRESMDEAINPSDLSFPEVIQVEDSTSMAKTNAETPVSVDPWSSVFSRN